MIILATTLAPEPGTTPGPGANAASGTAATFPGIYDSERRYAAASAFIRASDGFLAEDLRVL